MAEEMNVQEAMYKLFGAGDETIYATLNEALESGITLQDLVEAAQATLGTPQTVDLTALITTHNAAADAHGGVVRWKTAGKDTHGIYMQSATPPSDPGSVWIVI